jgi:hypothetical protein
VAKLYSFRYPFDIQTTLESWREKLSSPLTNNFDTVLARLSDRDRAIEDHLNLGLSQGRLAYSTSTAATVYSSDTSSDLANLSVTVTIPANRVLRVTGQAVVLAGNNGAGGLARTMDGFIYEDGVSRGYFAHLQLTNSAASHSVEEIQSNSIIVTPTPGAHTYKLVGSTMASAGFGTGSTAIGGVAASPAFILVEDLGPVNT